MNSPLILGIETSCDETAAAVYSQQDGILSNIIFSQVELHKLYGGVVPELASRSHIEKINSVVQEALAQSNKTLEQIDVIAVTNKPGLPGSLLIGTCFAKALAFAQRKKIIGINHLEGHVFSACIEHQIPFPFICLTASGGHTSIYLVHDFGVYEEIGSTLDDAAGEAFDKVAKIMNIAYPGGPRIEKLAEQVNFQDFYHFSRPKLDGLNFSFSGLKTAVLYSLVEKKLYDLPSKKLNIELVNERIKQEIASSLLVAISDIFTSTLQKALIQHPFVKSIAFVGGVACNKFIRKKINDLALKNSLSFLTPSAPYCTDNAAMIAFVGAYKARKNQFSDYNLDIL